MAQRHIKTIQSTKQIIDAAEANFTELYEGGGGGGTVQSATINGNTITPDANKNLALGNYATQTDFNGVTAKIPSAASSSNQLADKAFVNSSINNVASYYITKNANGDAFATKAELNAATTFYSGGVVRQPTRNDYTVVLADESKTITTTGENPTTRYIYNNGWDYQYIVNNSGLTAAQWSAVNSGITSTLVGKITANETAIAGKEASGIDLRLDGSNTMTGVLNLKASGNNETNIGSNGIRWNSTSLPQDTTVDYICTMDPFASGGRQKWCSLATLKTKLAVPTTYVTSVNGSSGAVTGLATTSDLSNYISKSTASETKQGELTVSTTSGYGIFTGSETNTRFTGVQATRLCTADGNNVNTGGFIINSNGTAKFMHRRGNRNTGEDAFFQFDATGYSMYASGEKGNTTMPSSPTFQANQNATRPKFKGTDLALYSDISGKADKATDLTGATKCKITYNSQGIVTGGADLDIIDITGLQLELDKKQPTLKIDDTLEWFSDDTTKSIVVGSSIKRVWFDTEYVEGGTGSGRTKDLGLASITTYEEGTTYLFTSGVSIHLVAVKLADFGYSVNGYGLLTFSTDGWKWVYSSIAFTDTRLSGKEVTVGWQNLDEDGYFTYPTTAEITQAETGIFNVWCKYVDYDTLGFSTQARATIGGLAASIGDLEDEDVNLQTQINNLKNIGRFLAIFNASAGTVSSQPSGNVGDTYTYKVGDYYRVGAAGTKYPKNTLVYTIDATSGSSNFETGSESLSIGDVIYCSNVTSSATTWVVQASSGGGTVQDVTVNGASVLSGGIAAITIPSISVSSSGSGNAITSITASGHTLTITKGSTFLTQHQSLSGYATETWVTNKGYTTNTGTVTSVAVKMNNTVKGTITTNGTIDLGTVLTSHQSLSGYVPTSRTIANIDLTDNITANELKTALNVPTSYVSSVNGNSGAITGIATTASLASYQTKVGALGGTAKPVYVSSAGTFSACSATVGSASTPVYMNAGTITACTTKLVSYSFASGVLTITA